LDIKAGEVVVEEVSDREYQKYGLLTTYAADSAEENPGADAGASRRSLYDDH
jgi:hypothetical protein